MLLGSLSQVGQSAAPVGVADADPVVGDAHRHLCGCRRHLRPRPGRRRRAGRCWSKPHAVRRPAPPPGTRAPRRRSARRTGMPGSKPSKGPPRRRPGAGGCAPSRSRVRAGRGAGRSTCGSAGSSRRCRTTTWVSRAAWSVAAELVRDALHREAEREQPLDDVVVQVAGYPVAILEQHDPLLIGAEHRPVPARSPRDWRTSSPSRDRHR